MANVTVSLTNDQCSGVKYHFGLTDQTAALAKLVEYVGSLATEWRKAELSNDATAIQNAILVALANDPNKINAVKAVLGLK